MSNTWWVAPSQDSARTEKLMWVFPSSSGVGTTRFRLESVVCPMQGVQLLLTSCSGFSAPKWPPPCDAGATALWKGYGRRPAGAEPTAVGALLAPCNGHLDYPQISGAFRIASHEVMTCCLWKTTLKCWWSCFRVFMVWSSWSELKWFLSPFIWGTSWSHTCGFFPIRLIQLWRNLSVIFQSSLH